MYNDKDMYRHLVVDLVIGDEEESWKQTIVGHLGKKETVTFYRDDEYHAPILSENDIADIAESIRCATKGSSYVIDARNAVLNGIDVVYNLRKVAHRLVPDFTEEDISLMQDDFLQRMLRRLAKYTPRGKHIIVLYLPHGRYAFGYGV